MPGKSAPMPKLPSARGPITAFLLDALRRDPHELSPPARRASPDALADEDLQLGLYLCYELHYRGLDGVHDGWEWESSLIALRGALETEFDAALTAAVPPVRECPAPEDMDLALRAIVDADDGPSLSRHLERDGTLEQFLEFAVHRSAYQLKEADPHSWAMPRLSGPPKAALVEIQADEYGGGHADRIHAELFARALRALGLDDEYGAYLDHVPGITLATVNLMS